MFTTRRKQRFVVTLSKQLTTQLKVKRVPALRVGSEKALLRFARRSFGMAKRHSSRLYWCFFRLNSGDYETSIKILIAKEVFAYLSRRMYARTNILTTAIFPVAANRHSIKLPHRSRNAGITCCANNSFERELFFGSMPAKWVDKMKSVHLNSWQNPSSFSAT